MARKEQIGIIQAYQKVFGGPNGKIVMDDLMRVHGMMNSSFTGKGIDGEIYFKEGERNVVLRILAYLKLDVNKLQERIEDAV